MRLLVALLWKDLRRAWRNPVGWMVFLAIPLVVTALIGMVFGPKSNSNALGRIRFAIVDEDDSFVSHFLRGGMNQGQGGQYLDPIFLDRTNALAEVQKDKLSALLVIPAGFTHAYLNSTNAVTLELIKNPAQSIHPAVLEELLGVVVTALDAIKQNVGPELPEWESAFKGDQDYHRVADLILKSGDKIEATKKLLFPPRVSYTRPSESGEGHAETRTSNAAENPKPSLAPAFNIFEYLLPGMVSMFLLFLGENASRDVRREMQQRTLQRFRSLHPRLYLFVASKVVFCFVFLLLGSAVMLVGGGLIFGIHWREPLAIVGLTASYCGFASGLMMLVPALLGDHQSSQALSNVIAMGMGLVGGSMFPPQQLPAFLRDHVTRFMPTYWYTETARAVAFDSVPAQWSAVAARLLAAGAVLMVLSALMLRRNLEKNAG
jgi:ABC-type multidrug transport system permease subunit